MESAIAMTRGKEKNDKGNRMEEDREKERDRMHNEKRPGR